FDLNLLLHSSASETNLNLLLHSSPSAFFHSSPSDYSQFNDYLTKTGLADEINSRQTITVLALNNGAMSDLAKHPVSVVKKALSLLLVLDYFDPTKLHKITDGSLISTTLYQTTGNAPINFGFVNITDLKGGNVGFGSAAPGSKLDSSYVKSVKQIPYNISDRLRTADLMNLMTHQFWLPEFRRLPLELRLLLLSRQIINSGQDILTAAKGQLLNKSV
ncbi:Fasciclin-like arabinogalactan protein 8, partial [Linum perenne]